MDKWLTSEEVATLAGVTLPTFYTWRGRGDAPRGARLGRKIMFKESDVQEWLTSRVEDSAC